MREARFWVHKHTLLYNIHYVMYKLKYDIKILEKLLRVPTYWFRI